MKPRRSWRNRIARALFFLLSAVIWIVVLGVGLETYETLRFKRADSAADAYRSERIAEGCALDAPITEASAMKTGNLHGGALPERETFFTHDHAGRAALADQREELILLCGLDGIVLACYVPAPPSTHLELDELAGLVKAGDSLASILDGGMGPDALNTLRIVAAAGSAQSRDYSMHLPSGTDCVFEFIYEPVVRSSPAEPSVAVFICPSIHEVVSFKQRPNVYRADAGTFYEYQSNSHGFRDEEITLPKPPGVYRIACIGGSTTLLGQRNELTYPNMLEAKLRQHFRNDKIEVINCGVIGIGSEGERKRFPDYLAIDPDLIIHYNFINDVTYELPKLLKPSSDAALSLKSIRWLLRRSLFLRHHFNWQLLPPQYELDAFLEKTTLANLNAMVEMAEAEGVDMAICSFVAPDIPNLDRRERDYFDYQINHLLKWLVNAKSYARLTAQYNAHVRTLCQDQGLLYIPVAEHMKGGTNYFTDICHMYTRAKEVRAQLIFEGMKGFVAARLEKGSMSFP